MLRGCSTHPDYTLIYECAVDGAFASGIFIGTTVWKGSAFNCTAGEISLVHQDFTPESGPRGECNNGSIVAIGRRLGTNNECCTSRLTVRVTTDMIGKSIECFHDKVVNTTLVGSVSIKTHTGKSKCRM